MMKNQQESTEEQIGFHKGSLATLSKERLELLKIVHITEQLMQAHIKALKDLGIDIEAEVKKAQQEVKKQKCRSCGAAQLRQNGTCMLCEVCGETSGCS